MIFTKEESYVLRLITQWGWNTTYCFFNNKEPYNCLAKKVSMPDNADFNGMIWICDDCKKKLLDKLFEEEKK